MGASIIIHPTGQNSYTHQWLKYMCDWSGLIKKDVELVSIASIDDLGLLLKQKTKPIRIIGGLMAFYDQLCSWYGDIVVTGEGFQFFKDYKVCQDLEKIKEKPYIVNDNEIIPSHYIDWSLAPAFYTRSAKRKYRKAMILGGRGCHNKCAFCFTSWTTKHQERPGLHLISPLVNVITNDSRKATSQMMMNRSMTVKDYLRMKTGEAKKCQYYRFGIEALTEKQRTKWGKPIKDDDITKLIRITKDLNHQIELFLIAGVEPQEDFKYLVDAIGFDLDFKPMINMKCTYLTPSLHTPLADYDLRKLHNWNKAWIRSQFNGMNRRIRNLTMMVDPGPSMARSLSIRAQSKDQFEILWKARNSKRDRVEGLIEKEKWSYLWDHAPSTKIKPWSYSGLKYPMESPYVSMDREEIAPLRGAQEAKKIG